MATTQKALKKVRDYAVEQQDIAFERAKVNYDAQKTDVEATAQSLAKEAYTQKRVQEKTLPNVLQQAGLQGQGYSETSANAIGTNYQNVWNQTMQNRDTNIANINRSIGDADFQRQSNIAEIKSKYEADLANYLESLRRASSGGSGGGSGGGSSIGNMGAKNAGYATRGDMMSAVRSGIRQIRIDPRKSSQDAIFNQLAQFIQPYVDNKHMTATEATAIIGDYLASIYSTAQGGSSTTFGTIPKGADYNQTIARIKQKTGMDIDKK